MMQNVVSFLLEILQMKAAKLANKNFLTKLKQKIQVSQSKNTYEHTSFATRVFG